MGRVVDSFDRANNASSLGSADVGGAWTANVGTWGINGNEAYRPTSGGTYDLATIDTGFSDGYVEFTLGALGESAQGLCFRRVDDDDFLFAQTIPGFTIWMVNKVVGGTLTTVLASDTGAPNVDGTRARVEFVGTAIALYLNGVLAIRGTISEHVTATKHGLYAASTVTNAARWDNFLAEPHVPAVAGLRATHAMGRDLRTIR